MPNQIKVSFHGSNLFIIDHNGEPYTPMKSIVEGMGMSWQGQHEKFKSNPERWGIKLILIPSVDRNNAMTCMPLRKLFGWLQTLQPNRVREDIRDKVIQYQDECDDVLWKHWTKQNIPNEIMPVMPPKTMRLLMVMEKGHVVSTQVVPDDCMVFGLSDIPNLIKEPGYFSVSSLKKIAEFALERIAEVASTSHLAR
ncbi:phage antirepressor N-terminal domain-containing protein [Vibrio cholerae]|uniref:phage antirepressor N-terminal domain-containing protein n=1 Tax=Vibrio cholerae TaxID=666 RepID=UPI00226E7B62|nr:phage antirepressor N-terminal domain-containing protein [Vibrio cholerae]MCX9470725.1 phage antirepressor N-terminal domain-containing protein [Vibrio cholerae]MCX9484209.1 phage antirepressor N-terminal domain-containing protein [Vibrio cholerae]MCX9491269.1 phage antirepressor N-terminal domain-containing protein [Vibrio cholerae]